MIAGPQDELRPVVFHEESAAEFTKTISDAVGDMVERNGSCTVFCDLVGGTPFNQAMLLTESNPKVQVVAGANLPMLLECLTSRDEVACAVDLANRAEEAGRCGVAHLSVTGEMCDESTGEDGI